MLKELGTDSNIATPNAKLSTTMDTSKAMQSLGKYSRYQLQSYFLVSCAILFPYSWIILGVVFIGDSPNYHCHIAGNDTVNTSIPTVIVDGEESLSQCSMYKEPGLSNTTVSCQHGFWYDPASGYDSTLVTEFDLTCNDAWLVELSITIMTIGQTISMLVCTRFSDVFGRKKVTLLTLWTLVLCTIVQAFSTSIYMYMAVSFFTGVCLEGMINPGYIWFLELFQTEQRTFASMGSDLLWATAYMVMSLLAYFFRNWRHLLLAISVPSVLSVSLYWLISESIPWLIANKKYKEAKEVLIRAHKMNKTELPSKLLAEGVPLKQERDPDDKHCHDDHNDNSKAHGVEHLAMNNNASKRLSAMDAFKNKGLRLYTIVLMCLWFVNGFVYYSASFTVTYLPGDRYLNSFLYALMEVPAYLICWPLVFYIGRVKPLCAYLVICGAAFIGSVITAFDCCSNMWQLSLTFSMLAKFGISSSYAVIILNTPEIFPTNIRTVGLGLCTFSSKLAVLLSPYTRLLYRTIPWLTPVILGILCLVAGLLALLLPETRHTPLPETLEEVEAMHKVRGRKTETLSI